MIPAWFMSFFFCSLIAHLYTFFSFSLSLFSFLTIPFFFGVRVVVVVVVFFVFFLRVLRGWKFMAAPVKVSAKCFLSSRATWPALSIYELRSGGRGAPPPPPPPPPPPLPLRTRSGCPDHGRSLHPHNQKPYGKKKTKNPVENRGKKLTTVQLNLGSNRQHPLKPRKTRYNLIKPSKTQ